MLHTPTVGAMGAADGSKGDPNYKRQLADYQKAWTNTQVSDGLSIAEAVRAFKPNVLLGLSTQPNIFNEEVGFVTIV